MTCQTGVAAAPPAKASPPDWERIEGEYRTGASSLREIADRHGITEGAIRKRAKRDDWEKDLQPLIRAKADAMVARAQRAVRSAKEGGTQGGTQVRTRLGKQDERAVIEATAEAVMQIRMGHRQDAARARTLVGKLWSELDGITGQPELAAQLGEIMAGEGGRDASRLQAAYDRILALPGRIDGVKKLAEALRTVISIEREAFDILPAAPAPAQQMAGAGVLLIDDDRLIAIATGSRG